MTIEEYILAAITLFLGVIFVASKRNLREAERDSEQASRAILPYSASMAVLGMAYVSETVLRIVAERLPLPAALAGKRDDD